VEVSHVQYVKPGFAVFIAGRSTEPDAIVLADITDPKKPSWKTLKSTSTATTSAFSRQYISLPQPITLKVPPKDDPLYVNYYPPTNPEYTGPDGEKPPCVINAHGGPTGSANQVLSWLKQFFTSRGFAWLDVNYRGSSGYGRNYIERLAGNWGVVDVGDCVLAAQQLSKTHIDGQRVFIRGGSAGGFTTLAAICTDPDVFAGATSLYGISDLRILVNDTHKFESKYMDKLLGGTIKEIPKVYEDRSPVTHADKIKTPLLILQGSEDKVVPPNQAETIAKSIQGRKGEVKYVVYPGEQHGWRKSETIEKALEEELAWYKHLIGVAE